jgi:hypothetical protein
LDLRRIWKPSEFRGSHDTNLAVAPRKRGGGWRKKINKNKKKRQKRKGDDGEKDQENQT